MEENGIRPIGYRMLRDKMHEGGFKRKVSGIENP